MGLRCQQPGQWDKAILVLGSKHAPWTLPPAPPQGRVVGFGGWRMTREAPCRTFDLPARARALESKGTPKDMAHEVRMQGWAEVWGWQEVEQAGSWLWPRGIITRSTGHLLSHAATADVTDWSQHALLQSPVPPLREALPDSPQPCSGPPSASCPRSSLHRTLSCILTPAPLHSQFWRAGQSLFSGRPWRPELVWHE